MQKATNSPFPFRSPGWRLWNEAIHALQAQGTWAATDGPLLEAYCRAVLLARTAREASDAEPLVTGSRGQLVPHPGIKMARDAEADARAAAAALLLTPEARQRHELAPARSVDADFAALLA